MKASSFVFEESDIDLSEKNITDSQLQMLFAVCHPSIPAESQIGLALRILCGFGIDEIANAFLTNKETINKRLFRAKEKLKAENIEIEFPTEAELTRRLDAVLLTLYLLFNEGYYSESQDVIVREDLCIEAMRLAHLLIDNEKTNLPPVNALLSLMCFHSSRLGARKDAKGQLVLYADQDETLWRKDLIEKGAWYLHQASQGNILSKYHLEASIAYWHTIKSDTKEKWENILQLYNHPLEDVVDSLKIIYKGGSAMSPNIARKVVDYFAPRRTYNEPLTAKEKQVIAAMVEGCSYKMIADRLGITLETVRHHIKNIYRKLHVNSKGEVIIKSIKGEI